MSAAAGAGACFTGSFVRLASATGALQPFSFQRLIAHARILARGRFVPRQPVAGKQLGKLGYDVFMGIRTRPGHELWAGDPLPFSIEFFPLDRNDRAPIAVHIVEHGRARRLRYDPSMFVYPNPKIAKALPRDLGYAGFRVHDRRTDGLEMLAFKSASYFRSPGTLNQYGLSARGVAVNTGKPFPESFPAFTAFWIVKPTRGDNAITIYALLEGEHVTGAYQMRCTRAGAVVMDIKTRLFQREPIERLGIAPLTSMFWFSETDARFGRDWRPEVHDSDGLAMATGSGQRLWRALDNPPRPDYSMFADDNPRGFGLLQRDRNFDHYQDSAVSFERRPSTWVKPRGDWGKGHVGLFEFPTSAEIHDNVNAFWVPEDKPNGHDHWAFDYRLSWTDRAPFPARLARVVATRTGRAGKPGTYGQQPPQARKFVLDFAGGRLAHRDPESLPEVRVSASQGRIVNPYPVAVGGDRRRWRAFFDWVGATPAHEEPILLQCALVDHDRVLTETWVYSYYPKPLP